MGNLNEKQRFNQFQTQTYGKAIDYILESANRYFIVNQLAGRVDFTEFQSMVLEGFESERCNMLEALEALRELYKYDFDGDMVLSYLSSGKLSWLYNKTQTIYKEREIESKVLYRYVDNGKEELHKPVQKWYTWDDNAVIPESVNGHGREKVTATAKRVLCDFSLMEDIFGEKLWTYVCGVSKPKDWSQEDVLIVRPGIELVTDMNGLVKASIEIPLGYIARGGENEDFWGEDTISARGDNRGVDLKDIPLAPEGIEEFIKNEEVVSIEDAEEVDGNSNEESVAEDSDEGISTTNPDVTINSLDVNGTIEVNSYIG